MNGINAWHYIGFWSHMAILAPLALGMIRSMRLSTEQHQQFVQHTLFKTAAITALVVGVLCFYSGPVMHPNITSNEADLVRAIMVSIIFSYGFKVERQLIKIAKETELIDSIFATIRQSAKDTK